METQRTRVLYVLGEYPQISQTYILSEIEAVRTDYDVRVVALAKADLPCLDAHPYECVGDPERIDEIIEEFRPHVLHTHYLITLKLVSRLAERHRVPFTVRTHSFDALSGSDHLRRAPLLNRDSCLGGLAFPFTRPALERAGCRPEKIIDCHPVIDYQRFHDRSPNGTAVMNVGACIPKKRMEDFVDLARLLPDRQFDLYPLGYATEEIRRYNDERGGPVHIREVVQPEDMPGVYKRHGWLVYTACPRLCQVGWPMAVAEAQAAGLGVCMPNLRPDLEEYVGAAGFLYDSIEELPRTLSQPYPEEMRELGFDQARRSDVQRHKHLLTDLWDEAASRPRRSRRLEGDPIRSP